MIDFNKCEIYFQNSLHNNFASSTQAEHVIMYKSVLLNVCMYISTEIHTNESLCICLALALSICSSALTLRRRRVLCQ